jgi:hypothetical protein
LEEVPQGVEREEPPDEAQVSVQEELRVVEQGAAQEVSLEALQEEDWELVSVI